MTAAALAAVALEAFLARLLVDPRRRARFLADPAGEAARAGFTGGALQALVALDRPGLLLAAASIAHKRKHRATTRVSCWRRWLAR